MSAPENTTIRVAACQWQSVTGDVPANWALAEGLLEQAHRQQAQLAVMPEMGLSGYIWREKAAIEPLAVLCSSAEVQNQWVAAAQKFDMWLVVGHPGVDEPTGTLRNRCTLVSPEGIVGHYDKTCLFPEDTHWAAPGTLPPPVWETPWGRVAPLICADMDYPEPLHHAVTNGAELIAFPTAWVEEPAPSAVWTIRAHELGIPVVAADLFGVDQGVVFSGGSCIIDGTGEVVDSIDYETGVVIADLTLRMGVAPAAPTSHEVRRVELPSGGLEGRLQVDLAVSGTDLTVGLGNILQPPTADIVVVKALTVTSASEHDEALHTLRSMAEAGDQVVVGSVINQTTGVAHVVTSHRGAPCQPVATAHRGADGVWQAGTPAAQAGLFSLGEVHIAVIGAWELRHFFVTRALAAQGVHVVVACGPAALSPPRRREASQAPFVLALGGEEPYFAHPGRFRAGDSNVWLALASESPDMPSGIFSPNHVWWPRREALAESESWVLATCTADTSNPWGEQSVSKPLVSGRRSDIYPDLWRVVGSGSPPAP